MNLFRNTVFEDVIKVKIEIKLYWLIGSPKSNESSFMKDKKGHTETEGRKPCDDGNRD